MKNICNNFVYILNLLVAKYWKLAKSIVPHVRAAWFKVLTVICQKVEVLLEGKEKEVTNTVFNSLDDNDPTVLPHVWEATLMIMSTLKVNRIERELCNYIHFGTMYIL